ncbi:hypothetical protein AYO45_05740 [Gammaproteobacteria bacterium SCGC AG-212-F23]|nr:hypothetical protein AYO45_05740 [Gammaproteobacteria bacterium SCGC AG-212-F23]
MDAKQGLGTSRAWWVVLTAALFFFYVFIQMNLFNPINQQIKQAFDLTAAELGGLGSMFFAANALFLFPAGILLDRFSTKKLILLALSFCIIGTFIFGLANAYWQAAAARFLVGMGASFCFLSCMRLASRWFQPSRMAFVTGIVITVAMLGGMVAQTPLALVSSWLGWRGAVLANAVLGIIIFALVFFIVEDHPPGSHENTLQDKAHLKQLGFWQSIRLALLNPQNWYGGLYTSLMNFPIFLLGALWGIPYLEQIHHLTHLEATYATAALFIGVIIGSPVYGWISDHIERRVLPMMVGAVISVVVMVLLMYVADWSLSSLIILFFLVGLVTSSQVLTYPTVAELNPSSLTSTAVGVDSATVMFSGVICQPLFGWLLERHWDHQVIDGVSVYSTQNFNAALLMMPVSFVIALVIAFLIRETHCKALQY